METFRGSLLMVIAMLAFALEDMVFKIVSQSLPLGQVLIAFGLGGMAVFAAMARAQGQLVWHPAFGTRVMLVRSLAELVGRLCFAIAIALTPLSSVSAILQAAPLVVAAGAVVFFGETVGWRRWLAIGCGLVGVLLILRPGVSGFEPASLFAVIAMLGLAGRDLATRAAPKTMSNAQLGFLGFSVLVVAGVCALAWTGGAQIPSTTDWAWLAAIVGVGVIAYMALTGAMRSGEIAIIAPFRYTRLVFAMILGIAIFGERPDMLTLIGSAVIIASGVFTLLRSQRK
ncbi:Uncharacterized membrane protein [Epibacterium ulvae]|uniref:Uncharacterized membrane protein n=1 Tax=Epibacterium ulvae TaxID=1156985 RepID=A0A1G5R7K3_9RHOB|nr:DMT family transporter [Epibacterium ulvae]SCZ69391.1 Uncharacterized membrane protein [Epibacterium ulvae]